MKSLPESSCRHYYRYQCCCCDITHCLDCEIDIILPGASEPEPSEWCLKTIVWWCAPCRELEHDEASPARPCKDLDNMLVTFTNKLKLRKELGNLDVRDLVETARKFIEENPQIPALKHDDWPSGRRLERMLPEIEFFVPMEFKQLEPMPPVPSFRYNYGHLIVNSAKWSPYWWLDVDDGQRVIIDHDPGDEDKNR